MTPNEAILYIENYGWSTTRLGLDRTRALLQALDHPERELKFVHVAGSNGKGSTCAMLASILCAAGYKTGLYISPYIQEFAERIQINGEYIPGSRLAKITERVKNIADAMEDHPSQFELVTAIAIQYYREEGCDVVVLEVGMGGLLDSTNAIDAPEVAVITNIGLEHTEYLGDTLEEIAQTKGGIIKPGCHCVCYDALPEVTETIRDICREKEVPFSIADFSRITPVKSDLDGQSFLYDSGEAQPLPFTIPLLGIHQLHNVSVVLETVHALRSRGWQITEEALREGLQKVFWPARFEVLNKDPVFILDGGHNPQCAQAMAESVKEYFPEEKITFLLGVLADKDYESILDLIMPYAADFICVTPLSDRALTGDALARFIRNKGGHAVAAQDISRGIIAALKTRRPVIAFGSLYLAGAVRTEFLASLRKYLRSTAIQARDALTEAERIEKSARICERIAALPAYQNAKTVMIYKWTRGEVKLDELEPGGRFYDPQKTFLYPLCEGQGVMIAIKPGEGADSWQSGAFGIREPVKDRGEVISPETIDLVLCPLAGFDENRNRLGKGGGYYDRFLPLCAKAVKIGVAFEEQKLSRVPSEPHDFKMDMIITEHPMD
ncbi:MAG: 5-formyltetrahydrofolate cyclo-ligase [Parasporobacterium sp.]|nr:5-formyltetrahydrofolate cyclo-ligase [Parasporobacterium sp.]